MKMCKFYLKTFCLSASNRIKINISTENVKTADRKPEVYTKPDGKKGVRMVPTDREVVKTEAKDVGEKRNVKYVLDNVIIQPGGKPTIWKFLFYI